MLSTTISRGLVVLSVFAATFTAAYAQGRVAAGARHTAHTA